MAQTIKELIEKLLPNPILIDMTYKYRNVVELSGFILKKPKFIKHDKKGVESASLLLYQINNANGALSISCWACMCYVKDLIEQLKAQEKVIFVATVGKLRYSPKIHSDYNQIVEMQTLFEFDLDMVKE